MTQPASVGTLSRCSIGTANPPAVAFEFKSFGLALHQQILSTDGIRGTHNHPSERTRAGNLTCSGSIGLNPGPLDLDTILPLATGGTKVVNTIGLGETLPSFNVVVDRVVKVFAYAGCVVDSMRLHATQGEVVELDLGVEALTETVGNAGTFTGSYNLQAPYAMMDCVLTVGGTAYQFRELTLTINNHLKKDRYMNSTVRTDLPFLDRTVEAELSLPYTTDTAALLYTGVTAESFQAVFTNGSDSLTIASSAFQVEPQSPSTPGREEILLPLRGQFRSVNTTAPLTFTNVSV